MSTDTGTYPEADAQERILLAIATIPRGRVATYGGIATAAGLPGRARLVGRILRHLPSGSRIPWHRVVASGGRIVIRTGSAEGGSSEQIARLRAEGVPLRNNGGAPRVDLSVAAWQISE